MREFHDLIFVRRIHDTPLTLIPRTIEVLNVSNPSTAKLPARWPVQDEMFVNSTTYLTRILTIGSIH